VPERVAAAARHAGGRRAARGRDGDPWAHRHVRGPGDPFVARPLRLRSGQPPAPAAHGLGGGPGAAAGREPLHRAGAGAAGHGVPVHARDGRETMTPEIVTTTPEALRDDVQRRLKQPGWRYGHFTARALPSDRLALEVLLLDVARGGSAVYSAEL